MLEPNIDQLRKKKYPDRGDVIIRMQAFGYSEKEVASSRPYEEQALILTITRMMNAN